MAHVSEYLNDIERAGEELSEVHMCTRFAERILCALLGYDLPPFVVPVAMSVLQPV